MDTSRHHRHNWRTLWSKCILIRRPEQSESSSTAPAYVPTSQRSLEPVPPNLIGKQPIQWPITGTNNLTSLQLQELALHQHSKSEALWCQAYLSLKGREPELSDDLEQALGVDKRHCRLAEDLSGYLHQRLSQQDGNRLAITLAGKSINIRAIGESILGFVSATKEFISLAASSEPHAALAWTGVSLLFPLLLNQKEQGDAMIQGLEYIATLIRQYKIRESLYIDRQTDYRLQTNPQFEDAVIKLYTHILEYEARFFRHLTRNPVHRGARNMGKLDDWQSWLDQVKKSNTDCLGYEELFDKEAERRVWTTQTQVQHEILEALKVFRIERDLERSDKRRRKMLQTLSTNYEQQKNINPPRLPNTCEWFLQCREFEEWRSASNSRLLWLSAAPGCGKSVLTRCLIDEDRLSTSSMTSTICYFFFKDGQEGQQTAANALKSITHQLLATHLDSDLIANAISKFELHGDKLGEMFYVLWSNLLETVKSPAAGEIVCVFDALDECEHAERRIILDSLIEFYSVQSNSEDTSVQLKFLITSRPENDIEVRFRRLQGNPLFTPFDSGQESDKIIKEIDRFIDYQIPLVGYKLGKADQAKIAEHLKSLQHRTYLWIYLMLQEIESNTAAYATERQVKKLIARLPTSIEKAYQKILNNSKDPVLARKVLLIIIAAKRALTISEMSVAFALVTQEDDCKSYESLDCEPSDTFKSSLTQLCGQFISVYDNYVFLIHQTAREFLLCSGELSVEDKFNWKQSFHIEDAESTMAHACISVLRFADLYQLPKRGTFFFNHFCPEALSQDMVDSYPFFQYAAAHWPSHYHSASDDVTCSLLAQAVSLCNVKLSYVDSWYPIFVKSFPNRGWLGIQTSLDIASSIGACRVVIDILNSQARNEYQQCDYGEALIAAASFGHENVMKLLLKNGADINHCSDKISTPLNLAISIGDVRSVQLLLGHGADANVRCDQSTSPLQHAAISGHSAVCQLLIDTGANVNAVDGTFRTALIAAIYIGNENMVRMLFNHGARFCKGDWQGFDFPDANISGKKLNKLYEKVKSLDQERIVRTLLSSGLSMTSDLSNEEYD